MSTSDKLSSSNSGFADLPGARLYYEAYGQGPPVVLVHGFSFDRRMWTPQLPVLAEKFRVLCYDMRGYGQSGMPAGRSYSHSGDLFQLLQALQIHGAHIVGLSLGGLVAINFALEHPEMVSSLVVVDAVIEGFPRKSGSSGQMLSAICRRDGVEAARAFWLSGESLLGATMQKPHAAEILRLMVQEYSCWHLLNTDTATAVVPSPAERLSQITAPTLVTVGENDSDEFRTMANELVTQIPNARLEVIPGSGHVPNLEEPEYFNQLLMDFLREVQGELR